MPIITAKAKKTKATEMTSVEDDDIKKGYWEHPAISNTILLNWADNPALLLNVQTAITNNKAATISKANTALYSLPLKIFKNGIMEKVKPGGKNQKVSKTG